VLAVLGCGHSENYNGLIGINTLAERDGKVRTLKNPTNWTKYGYYTTKEGETKLLTPEQDTEELPFQALSFLGKIVSKILIKVIILDFFLKQA